MSNYDLIKNAILNKHQIFATYDGFPRELCPHALGKKNGREQALFYQFGGSGSKGPVVPGSLANWRCIPVDGLVDISVKEGEWHSAGNHSKKQTCIEEIDIEIQY